MLFPQVRGRNAATLAGETSADRRRKLLTPSFCPTWSLRNRCDDVGYLATHATVSRLRRVTDCRHTAKGSAPSPPAHRPASAPPAHGASGGSAGQCDRQIGTEGSVWGAGFIFFDEIKRCRPDLRNRMFPLVHERRIGGVDLPDLDHGWARGQFW
jgi:hypothetical protein